MDLYRKLGRKLQRANPDVFQKLRREFDRFNNIQQYRPWLRSAYPKVSVSLKQIHGSEKVGKLNMIAFLHPDFQPRCEQCGVPTSITPTGSLRFNFQRFCSRDCSNSADETNRKRKETSLRTYGVSNISQSPLVQRKKERTCFKNYGVTNPWRSAVVQKRILDTIRRKYGVDHPAQNSDINHKMLVARFRRKEVILSSGKVVMCQGFEPFVLKHLDELETVSRIYTGKQLPTIPYIDRIGKTRTYHPDIGVKTRNGKRLIEVKSAWTLLHALNYNGISKFRAATEWCKSRGVDYYVALVVGSDHDILWIKNPTKRKHFKNYGVAPAAQIFWSNKRPS